MSARISETTNCVHSLSLSLSLLYLSLKPIKKIRKNPPVPSSHPSSDTGSNLYGGVKETSSPLSPPPSPSHSGHTGFLSVSWAHHMLLHPRPFARAVPFFPSLVKSSLPSTFLSFAAPVLAWNFSCLWGIFDLRPLSPSRFLAVGTVPDFAVSPGPCQC